METITATTSDLEMISQTETEDTDAGEMNVASSSDLNTSLGDSMDNLNTSFEAKAVGTSQVKEELDYLIEKSVDLTDVTELSNIEDFSGVDRKNSFCNKMDEIDSETSQLSDATPKFDFTGEWYKQKCFQRYWDHYYSAMAWCQKHFQLYKDLQQKYQGYSTACRSNTIGTEFSSWHHPYQVLHGSNMSRNSHASRSSDSGRVKRWRNQKQKKRSASSQSHTSETATQTSGMEEFEMEFTPEMLEFFAKSQKHKEERDEQKRTHNDTKEELERINIEEVKAGNEKVPTVKAPKQRPGSKRTEEMKLLYGKGAAMIHGMETAIQMTFDRNTDLRQPKVWPNMPLKIVFN